MYCSKVNQGAREHKLGYLASVEVHVRWIRERF